MTGRPSEFALISKLFAPLATHPGALALTDDACLLTPEAGCELVVTADALTSGVHFLPDDPPNLIAAKALRVNLSDLAAKGAQAVGYLLALALPQDVDTAWLECFVRGLDEDQKRFDVSLLGGDTTATPGPLSIAITAIGQIPSGMMVRRSGAKLGDHVYVTGTIGDAGAGLAVLQGKLQAGSDTDFLVGRYRAPTPRLPAGRALRGIASAALDVSDGLLADLGHIAEVSGVRLVIEADCIPRSSAVQRLWSGDEGVVRAATSGDDYEIAFTAPMTEMAQFADDVPVTRIGRVEAGLGVVLLSRAGREISVKNRGFVHF